jgi:hypothetical protein
MQQRQLRLGDILDDYCPRERRVTNHVIVALVGDEIKQTRCATCDTEHEYKHAKVPRQRKKTDTPAGLYAQVLAGGPKRVTHDDQPSDTAHAVPDPDEAPIEEPAADAAPVAAASDGEPTPDADAETDADRDDDLDRDRDDEGPVHRPLIRASLPKHDGQQAPPRPIPEFTIRQPGGRPNRFRPRGGGPGGGGGQFGGGNRSNGNMPGGPRGMRSSGGRPPQGGGGNMPSRPGRRRHGPHGPKRSK